MLRHANRPRKENGKRYVEFESAKVNSLYSECEV